MDVCVKLMEIHQALPTPQKRAWGKVLWIAAGHGTINSR